MLSYRQLYLKISNKRISIFIFFYIEKWKKRYRLWRNALFHTSLLQSHRQSCTVKIFVSCHILLFVKNLIINLLGTTKSFLNADEVIITLSLGEFWKGSETRADCIDDTEKVNAIWYSCISFSDVEMWQEWRIILISHFLFQLSL